MSESGLAKALSGCGLTLIGMADPDTPLIPPLLAGFATSTPPGAGRLVAMLDLDEPDLSSVANAAWYSLCVDGGFFDTGDPSFLIAVDCSSEDMPKMWRWATVQLSNPWDVMGAGAASGLLGNGHSRPAFVMLSLDGSTIVRGDTWQTQIGAVLVQDPHEHEPFWRQGERLSALSRTGDWEKKAIKRWLNLHPRPVSHPAA